MLVQAAYRKTGFLHQFCILSCRPLSMAAPFVKEMGDLGLDWALTLKEN